MANIINQLATSNTFLQWLTATQSVISTTNALREGGSGETFVANTNIEIANDVAIGGNLTVSGNITLDAIGFDDLIVSGGATIGTTLSVTGNTTLTNATINYGNLPTANIVLLTGSANTAIYANITSAQGAATAAFLQANSNYISAVTRLTVTNSGSSAYLIDQYTGNNPSIYVSGGETIAFNLNGITGHPFMIRVSSGGSNYDTGLTHVANNGTVTTQSSAQGQVSGTLYWKVPFDLIGSTYVYQCSNHAGMVGNIVIQQPASFVAANTQLAFNAANNAASDGLAFAIALG
jgi:plastocyanin